MLDTNILIEMVHGNRVVMSNVERVGPEHCFISVISLHEMYFGAYNAPKEIYTIQELRRINWLRDHFSILDFSEKDAEEYGKIKTHLRRIGRPVDEFDILIGEQAITRGMNLVTHNVKHFENMPHISISDWTH